MKREFFTALKPRKLANATQLHTDRTDISVDSSRSVSHGGAPLPPNSENEAQIKTVLWRILANQNDYEIAKEIFEERAGIVEYDARQPRLKAETMALDEVINYFLQSKNTLAINVRNEDRQNF